MTGLKPERRAIVAAACTALALGTYFLHYRPTEVLYRELQEIASRSIPKSVDLRGTVDEVIRLRAEKGRKERLLESWRKVLRHAPDTREVLGRVTGGLEALGTGIGRFTPLPVSPDGGKTIRKGQVHQVLFEATYEQVVSFLRGLGRLPFVLRIERVKMDPLPGNAGRLQVSLNYSVLSRSGGEKGAGR
jgi:hypothetical protein